MGVQMGVQMEVQKGVQKRFRRRPEGVQMGSTEVQKGVQWWARLRVPRFVPTPQKAIFFTLGGECNAHEDSTNDVTCWNGLDPIVCRFHSREGIWARTDFTCLSYLF